MAVAGRSASGRSASGLNTARAVVGFLLAGISLVFIELLNGIERLWGQPLPDGRVFIRAIEAVRDGHGPYDLIYGPDPDLYHLPLVSPPHVAWVLEWFARAGYSIAVLDVVLCAVTIAGLLTAVLVSARMFFGLRFPDLSLAWGVFAGMISGSGMIALVTGNIAGLLWGLFLLTGALAWSSGRWKAFHLAVLLAVLFKPFYVTLWLLPLFARGWSWRQLFIAVAGLLSAAAVYVGAVLSRPDLTQGWLSAMASRLAVADVGAGIYAALRADSWLGEYPALAVHGVYGLVLLTMVSRDAVGAEVPEQGKDPMRFAVLLLVAIALNPRLNAYDYAFAAIPSFYVYQRRLQQLVGQTRGAWLMLPLCLLFAWASCVAYRQQFRVNSLLLVTLVGGAVLVATQEKLLLRLFARATDSGAERQKA